MKTKTKKTAQYIDKNPIEAIRNIGDSAAQAFKKDVAEGAISDFWAQLLGVEEKTKGELQEGQELDLRSLKQNEEDSRNIEVDPGIDYRRQILYAHEQTTSQENRGLQMQIEQVLEEIKKLANTTQELEIEYREVIVEQRIEKPGKYHVRFFEWMLSAIRTARMRVEESSSWLSMFASKKKKREYWNMFKKHGTTFGLSNERVVATQTG